MTWGYIGAAAITVVGGYLSKKKESKDTAKAVKAQNPYGPYRNQAATQLNSLMNNPDSITSLPEYKARLQAASRVMAAQGYTGSGNALVAAANAGGTAYQQAFNNLATLSGAGVPPGQGAMTAALTNGQNDSDYLNSAIYAGSRAWDAYSNRNGPPISDPEPDYNFQVTPAPFVIDQPTYSPPPVQPVSATGG